MRSPWRALTPLEKPTRIYTRGYQRRAVGRSASCVRSCALRRPRFGWRRSLLLQQRNVAVDGLEVDFARRFADLAVQVVRADLARRAYREIARHLAIYRAQLHFRFQRRREHRSHAAVHAFESNL